MVLHGVDVIIRVVEESLIAQQREKSQYALSIRISRSNK
jgi:hypothetical protein